MESLQEVKIVANTYSAEFGNDIGAVVQYETKSGTNTYHGGGYEYLRNTALDSYNGFTRVKAPDKQHTFGGTVGGPIKKDKLFFFAAVEAQKWTVPISITATVPTAAEKKGDFSALLPNTIIYDPATTCGTGGNPACAVGANGKPIITRTAFPGNIIPANRIDSSAALVEKYIPDPTAGGFTQNLPSASGSTLRKIKATNCMPL